MNKSCERRLGIVAKNGRADAFLSQLLCHARSFSEGTALCFLLLHFPLAHFRSINEYMKCARQVTGPETFARSR